MKKDKINSLMSTVIFVALLLSAKSNATDVVDGKYIWNFSTELPWPEGYQQNIGKPDALTYNRNDYTPEFFERINNALPEQTLNEAFITDDSGSIISLNEEAEVFITFIHEGAGYKNSFGYFLFDPENPPNSHSEIEEKIVFPNLSYPHLTNGHRLSIGTFPAGTHIGFFIAANGYWYDTGVKPFKVPYYYSLPSLNPESDPDLKQHTVLLYDEEVSEVIIGFEDLPRTWGDNDFNDAIFSVKSTPESAIVATNLLKVPEVNDSDADGIADELDAFPNDYTRAYASYFPNANSYVTLAYEDNWPKTGDYDFNDLVVKEQLQVTYNSEGLISGFILNGEILARGGSHHNGFALRLIGIEPSNIARSFLEIDNRTYEKSPENFQSEAVIALWQDTHIFTTTNESGPCTHFNTNKDCSYFEPVAFRLDVKFNESISVLNHSNFDFFIFRTEDRSHEIHFAGYSPTDLFDFGKFGRFDDTSNPTADRYYLSENNLPWALKVNDEWAYPREYIDILWAYPDYENWVESSGQEATDWYKTSPRTTHFYKIDQ